jgi:hypothetical protein
MKRWLACFWICLAQSNFGSAPNPVSQESTRVIIVVGAPGEPQYAQLFGLWAANWEEACRQAGASYSTVGLQAIESTQDIERVKALLESEPRDSQNELWLVLIGHGTFHGNNAKFNLRGPDFSASDLAGWLQPFKRPLMIINTASASGPFINALSGENRVIITATRSGHEQNFARFGQFFSEAILDADADLDKDGQVSLLEAFLRASHAVADFYQTDGRLATEHALLDDNGDGLGTPPDWFRGVRAAKKAGTGALPDGLRAHQVHLLSSQAEQKLSPAIRARRNELEIAILRLRETKDTLSENEYYQSLEPLLVELAELYESSDADVAAGKTSSF